MMYHLWVQQHTSAAKSSHLFGFVVAGRFVAATVLLTYLKLAQFLQAFPGLGRLVQLVLVGPAMQKFMLILGLAVAGLGLAFILVFSAGLYSAKSDNKDSGSVATDAEIDHCLKRNKGKRF